MKKYLSLMICCFPFALQVNAQSDFSTSKITRIAFTRNASADKMADLHQVDLNNDGFTDVVADGGLITNQSGYIRHNSKPVFFVNDGRGNLTPAATTFVHTGSSSMISDLADYNNDGLADMLVYDFWGNSMRLYNGGAGLNFTLGHTLPTGTHGAKGYFDDLDNDGDLDIYNVSSGSAANITLHIFTNDKGVFSKTSYATSSTVMTPLLWAKDVNHDGRKDIVITAGNDVNMKKIGLWLQKPDNSFEPAVFEDLNTRMRFGAFGSLTYTWEDLNNDNFEDIIFLNDRDDNDSVHANAVYSAPAGNYLGREVDLSGPAFSREEYAAYSGQMLVSGDIDKDGTLDLITCNRVWDPASSSRMLRIFSDPFNRKGNHSVRTLDLGLTDITIGGSGLLLADLENDKDLELLSLGQDDTLRIFGLNPKPTGIRFDEKEQNIFTLFPNPSRNKLYLEISNADKAKITSIGIYTAEGRLLHTYAAATIGDGIPIGGLPQGNYLLSAEMKDGSTHSRMFIKE